MINSNAPLDLCIAAKAVYLIDTTQRANESIGEFDLASSFHGSIRSGKGLLGIYSRVADSYRPVRPRRAKPAQCRVHELTAGRVNCTAEGVWNRLE